MKHSLSVALACAVLLLAVSNVVVAGTENEVPSCYAANKVEHYSPVYDKLVYVLIDQTLPLDKDLQNSALHNLARVLKPGTKFVIAEFSAFAQGRYLKVLNTGVIEKPIPQAHIGDVVLSRLHSFQACLKSQKLYAQKLAIHSAYSAFANSTSSLDHSDIFMALKMVSTSVVQDPAAKKLLFLVSDGLENSSITSFYAHSTLRHLDVDAELAKVRKNALLGDFGGARVYVIGGADLPPAGAGSRAQREGYRNPTSLLALKRFWDKYFTQSNAKLVEFGEPALVNPMRF